MEHDFRCYDEGVLYKNHWLKWNTYLHQEAHSLILHGYKVDVGKLVMAHFKAVIGKKISIYHRFLMLCINSLCGIIENAPWLRGVKYFEKKHKHTALTSQNSIHLFHSVLHNTLLIKCLTLISHYPLGLLLSLSRMR